MCIYIEGPPGSPARSCPSPCRGPWYPPAVQILYYTCVYIYIYIYIDRPRGTQILEIPKKHKPRIPKKQEVQTKKPRNSTKKPRNTNPILPMQTTQDASMCSHALNMHIPHGTSPLPTPQ